MDKDESLCNTELEDSINLRGKQQQRVLQVGVGGNTAHRELPAGG